MFKTTHVAGAIALLLFPALSAAQSNPNGDEHRGPSPESIAACKDKAEGDACEFDGPHGHVAGTCRKSRDGDLACRHPHHHQDGGPPTSSVADVEDGATGVL
jgi:hypothetical protein